MLQNHPLGIRELSESSVAVSATEKTYKKENERKHNFLVVETTLEWQQEGQGLFYFGVDDRMDKVQPPL